MEQHTNTRRAVHCVTHQHTHRQMLMTYGSFFLSVWQLQSEHETERNKNNQQGEKGRQREPLTHVQQFLCLVVDVVVVVFFLLLFLCFSVFRIRTQIPLTNALELFYTHTISFWLALPFTVPRELCTVHRCDHHQHTSELVCVRITRDIVQDTIYFFSTWFVIALNLFKVSVQLATYELVYTYVRTLPIL